MLRDDELAVTALSDVYEDALLRNDVELMNSYFAQTDDVRRFGISDMQTGYADVVAWRATATPVDPQRRILERSVVALGPGVVAVDLTFMDSVSPGRIGRQSQTWVLRAEGWRIVRAHVSVIAAG